MTDPSTKPGPTIDFWYEFASTYSYPAAMRIEREAANYGVQVRWQPFLLGPVFKVLGWATSPFNLQPAKGRYMWHDLNRTCAGLGLAFHRPDPFPQESLLAARIALSLPDNATRAEFSRRIFSAEFADRHDISDPAIARSILAGMNLPANQVLAAANETANKAALRSKVDEAVALDIFGAPTFVTADGEVFWGNDRLDEALQWAQRTSPL